MTNNYTITYKGKSYALDLEVLKKVCLISDLQKGKETEITENYTKNEEGVLEITEKLTREMKGPGNPQNDMIVYDIVKLLITALLSNNLLFDEEDEVFYMDFATSLAFNTCIKCGILVEI